MKTLAELTSTDARTGRIAWIGLRPERRAPMRIVDRAALALSGLDGDRSRAGKRALTLFQDEHLDIIGAYLGRDAPAPETLRRNLHVSGLNLSAFRGARLRLGAALVEITGPCAPCSRMEQALGPGGYNALRGHGGWCATVLEPGRIALGDPVLRA